LPRKPPFSSSLSSEVTAAKVNSRAPISNKDLLGAIQDREVFYKLYIDITNRAISMYTKAGRRKSALKLHGSLAALDLYVIIVGGNGSVTQIPEQASWTT
jgi:hypothetical protein